MIELYPFQKEAVEKMQQQRGFLLADEMGLGKTVEALAAYEGERLLVVCPKSAISVWTDHIQEMLDVEPVVGFDSNPICVTNWDQLRVNPAYSQSNWDTVIADEAHMGKNRKAKRTRALWRIPTYHRWALSGTPMVNRPDELWAILHWLYPQKFTSYWKFYNRYVDFTVNPWHGYHEINGPKNVRELRELLRPYYLRRRKKDVLHDLPDKYYTYMNLDLTQEQKRAYEEMRKRSLAWIGEHGDQPVAAPEVIAQLVRLRQFAAAYAEFEGDKIQLREPSSKLDAVMDIVQDTDGSVVVFTQFRGVVKLLADRLRASKIPTGVLHGETPQEDRSRVVKDFQDRRIRVLVCTAQTGGVGITLTAASTAVFVDRSWSPAVNEQAEDRLHRIGQKNAVQIIVLQANGTVDKVVEDKLELKRKWFSQILEGVA